MGIDERNASNIRDSTQEVLNKSQDTKYDVLGVEILAENPAGDALERLLTGARGELRVIAGGYIDEGNSTVETLLADGVFPGVAASNLDNALIIINVFSNVPSATDGVELQVRLHGSSTWRTADVFTLPANSLKTWSFQTGGKDYRIMFTNGGSDQGVFELETMIKNTMSKSSSHRIQDSIVDEDDAELVKSVLSGEDDVTGNFDNVKTYRKALQVDNALVHQVGISEHAKRDLGGTTTLDVEASSGDILINVASTTGFEVDDLLTIKDTSVTERSHFHITAVDAGVSLTLNRPIDNDFEIGDDVTEIDIAMVPNASLGSPVSYKVQPPLSERWQITRILITMLAPGATAMDDGKFANLTALTNGVVLRTNISDVDRTLTHWQSNGDLKDDMFDVLYSDKPPAGAFHGLSARWTFTKAEFVVDLNGATGDYLEVLIQDDLSGLSDFEIKAQGRLFGG